MKQEKLTIGQQLLSQRQKLGLTQGELYSKSGISTATIGRLEQGKMNDCSTYVLRQLSKALNFYKFEI